MHERHAKTPAGLAWGAELADRACVEVRAGLQGGRGEAAAVADGVQQVDARPCQAGGAGAVRLAEQAVLNLQAAL